MERTSPFCGKSVHLLLLSFFVAVLGPQPFPGTDKFYVSCLVSPPLSQEEYFSESALDLFILYLCILDLFFLHYPKCKAGASLPSALHTLGRSVPH